MATPGPPTKKSAEMAGETRGKMENMQFCSLMQTSGVFFKETEITQQMMLTKTRSDSLFKINHYAKFN